MTYNKGSDSRKKSLMYKRLYDLTADGDWDTKPEVSIEKCAAIWASCDFTKRRWIELRLELKEWITLQPYK